MEPSKDKCREQEVDDFVYGNGVQSDTGGDSRPECLVRQHWEEDTICSEGRPKGEGLIASCKVVFDMEGHIARHVIDYLIKAGIMRCEMEYEIEKRTVRFGVECVMKGWIKGGGIKCVMKGRVVSCLI